MDNEMNSFVSAVDNHNVANGDGSWIENKLSNTSEFASDVAQGATYGVLGAVVAGVNSIANSGIAIANFVGADIEEINTHEVLRSMDDDLGKYYDAHKEGVELGGFVLGALIPGTAGVKMLQAAKAGFMGTNIARTSGILRTVTADYAKMAKAQMASGQEPFKLLNENMVKSIAQGFGSAAIESTAFEIAVAGSMFKSPVLEDQGASNIAWNIITGTAIGGGLGGILHSVGTVYGVKKSIASTKTELFPFQHINELQESAPADLKLINYFQQKLNLPEAKLAEDYGPIRPGQISKDLDPTTRLELITKERAKTQERLDVLIRQEFNRYAGNDPVIGQQLFSKFKDQQDIGEVAAALINSKGAQRITANEKLVVGDVLFPAHGIKREDFQSVLASGNYSSLLADTATEGTQGFRVIGDTAKLKVTGAGEKAGDVYLGNRDAAFAANYDLYRNLNGTFSVNPGSEILARSNARRVPNNLIVDFEKGGAVVDKATPGLADLATKANPVEVRGNTVLSGGVDPIKITDKFHPVDTEDYLHVQARYIWAQEQKNIRWNQKVVDENDLPLLERAYYEGDKAEGLRIRLENGKVVAGATGERLKGFIDSKKKELASSLSAKNTPLDEMSMRLNVSAKWLLGEADEIAKLRQGVDYNTPRYARIDYPDDIHAMEAYNAAHIDGMVQYENNINIVKQRHIQNTENYLSGSGITLPEEINFADPGRGSSLSTGAGASLFGFANSNFGSAGGWAQFVGTITNRIKIWAKTQTVESLNNSAAVVNTPALRSELDLVTNKLRSSPEAWVFHPEDSKILIKREDYKNVLAGGKPTETINMSEEVSDFLGTHSTINSRRQVHVKNLKGTAGVMDDSDLAVVYPPPLDTTKYKHFVFVEPKGMNLGDKKRMIVAKDEATLVKLMNEVDTNDFRLITKQESEEWKKAIGEYDFSLGLNESAVDSSMKRKGVLAEHFAGNPSNRILDDYLDWHVRQEETLATRMVEHRYSQSFQELQHLGDRYTNIATSQFRSLTDALVDRVKDPYQDIVKTALDISRSSEYQWWRSFNETVKDAVEGPARALGSIFAKTPEISDAFVAEVNKKSTQLGLGTPFRDAYTAQVASGNIADKPFLAKYIGKAQALMSSTLLQLDFFNAVNNVISTPILLSAETKFLLNAIQNSNPESAGKLAQLMSVMTPEGAQAIKLPTTARLLKNAVENIRRDSLESLGLTERYQNIGAITDVIQQERQMVGHLTANFGTATAGQLEGSLQKALEFGRKWTGNTLAEQTTRFVAADVMRQITDIALEAGVLKNVGEANEYIQLFVNKVQGNYLHSQRPIVFQGVVGQAVSLFQTYQFNLMQQLFKYVGEGDKKSIGMLLGLQGSIYGMQGLPAFNFLNTHIVGNASGNTQHRDLYYASNSVFGKQLGDWLLYGAGSNALSPIDSRLKVNLYSRGDINPRQLTVLPTTLSDVPVVNASVGFVKNIYSAIERTGNGAAIWPTISQAIEHNGLSRPLAGLAQVVQGYTTTNQGSLLVASQDFYNIATVSRLAGGKPFDESIALDALYRVNAYRAKDLARIQDVGSALKTSLIAGREPTEQEVTNFAANYAKSGGRMENFSKFMAGEMISANRSQVNKLAENLKSPFATQMQVIMGGQPLPDFMNSPK